MRFTSIAIASVLAYTVAAAPAPKPDSYSPYKSYGKYAASVSPPPSDIPADAGANLPSYKPYKSYSPYDKREAAPVEEAKREASPDSYEPYESYGKYDAPVNPPSSEIPANAGANLPSYKPYKSYSPYKRDAAAVEEAKRETSTDSYAPYKTYAPYKGYGQYVKRFIDVLKRGYGQYAPYKSYGKYDYSEYGQYKREAEAAPVNA